MASFGQILGRLSADYLPDKHFISDRDMKIQLHWQIIYGSLSIAPANFRPIKCTTGW
jgi:hypothetical protein